jgi:hypothetical protein
MHSESEGRPTVTLSSLDSIHRERVAPSMSDSLAELRLVDEELG